MKTGKYVKKQENGTETITNIDKPSDEIRRLEIYNRETLHADKQEKYIWFICYD